jgi:Zn-finger nucleic acid-binding protein
MHFYELLVSLYCHSTVTCPLQDVVTRQMVILTEEFCLCPQCGQSLLDVGLL